MEKTAGKNLSLSKIGIYLSHVSLKDVQATGEAFSHQKRTSSTLKNEIYYLFFVGHFCSPGSRPGSGLLIPDMVSDPGIMKVV